MMKRHIDNRSRKEIIDLIEKILLGWENDQYDAEMAMLQIATLYCVPKKSSIISYKKTHKLLDQMGFKRV